MEEDDFGSPLAKSFRSRYEEFDEPTSVAHNGPETDEDSQESSCSNVGCSMNFVNEYIYVQELKSKKDFIDQVLKDYDNKVLQVMKTEGYMSVEDYHYLFALKDVRNYLVNQKLGINNLLHEWDTFDKDTLEQVKKYINSFQNDSVIRCKKKIHNPLLK